MKIEEIRSLDCFRALRPDWDRLLAQQQDPIPFLSHDWLSVWWEAFATGSTRMRLVVAWANGELVAAAPMVARRVRLWGVPVECIEFAANLHTPCFDFLLPAGREPAPFLAPLLDHLLLSRPRPDVLFFKDLRRDASTTAALLALASTRSVRVGVENTRRSPRIAIQGTWEDYLRRRPKHFRANLNRYRRRWQDLGGVLEVVDDPTRGACVLEEGLRMEASGWKGREGTAILSDEQEAEFYRRLLSSLAGRDWLRQYVLRRAGRAVAWDLCLIHNGVSYALKTAYDESHRGLYPGFELQRQELVGAFSERRVACWDLLPPESEFKSRWCDHATEQLSLRLYSDRPRGRVAHLLFGRLRPRLARSPRLRRLRQLVRGRSR